MPGITSRLRASQPLRDMKRAARHALFGMDTESHGAIDVAQKQLVATWRGLAAQGVILPFDQVGFQVRSGDEEDGLLLYILTLVGSTNRTVVEISSQDGRVCMAANLIIHHRWRGFLFDGDPVFVEAGRRFFSRHPATQPFPPVMESRWFTRDNINQVLQDVGVPAEIDLLSLDIDGVDLHLWKALTAVRPRVLIAEFNNAVPSDRSITVPYSDDFAFSANAAGQELYRSASLAAYDKVSREKGYRLVAMNALGYNAIFLRNDIGTDLFPTLAVSALDHVPAAVAMRETHWPVLQGLAWDEV